MFVASTAPGPELRAARREGARLIHDGLRATFPPNFPAGVSASAGALLRHVGIGETSPSKKLDHCAGGYQRGSACVSVIDLGRDVEQAAAGRVQSAGSIGYSNIRFSIHQVKTPAGSIVDSISMEENRGEYIIASIRSVQPADGCKCPRKGHESIDGAGVRRGDARGTPRPASAQDGDADARCAPGVPEREHRRFVALRRDAAGARVPCAVRARVRAGTGVDGLRGAAAAAWECC